MCVACAKSAWSEEGDKRKRIRVEERINKSENKDEGENKAQNKGKDRYRGINRNIKKDRRIREEAIEEMTNDGYTKERKRLKRRERKEKENETDGDGKARGIMYDAVPPETIIDGLERFDIPVTNHLFLGLNITHFPLSYVSLSSFLRCSLALSAQIFNTTFLRGRCVF